MVCIDEAVLRPGFQSGLDLWWVDILSEKTTMTSRHYTGLYCQQLLLWLSRSSDQTREPQEQSLSLHGNAAPPQRATTQYLEGEELHALSFPAHPTAKTQHHATCGCFPAV